MNESTTSVSRNPASGEVIGSSKCDSLQQLQDKYAASRHAQPAWHATPLRERVRAMLRVRRYLLEHADQLAATISQDNGKTRVDALATEIVPAAMAVGYYAKHARRFLKTRWLRPSSWLVINKVSIVRRVPWGVVGIISPWNYPFGIPFSEVVMALLAGNTVILKTASDTQLVGRAIEDCFAQAGLPQGVFAFVNLPGHTVGQAMLDAGVDKLFFTGSVEVGKSLMAKAAATLTPLCLELGGNDAMLVCPDASLQRAAAGATWAGMQNCGQSCGGVERVYVHADVYQPFLELLAEKVQALRVGPDTDHHVDLGAMTTSKQVALVRDHIQDALLRGAVIAAQSNCVECDQGLFLPATVLTNVDHTMRVMREETFGPVVAVMKVENMEQAVRYANDSHLGLSASVWSRNRKTAHRLATQIQAGAVTINDHLVSHGLAETPWGGFKQSGIGRTHGELGFAEMTQPQCVVHDWLPMVQRNCWWYPHDASVYMGLQGALELLAARSPWRKTRGMARFLRTFCRTFRSH